VVPLRNELHLYFLFRKKLVFTISLVLIENVPEGKSVFWEVMVSVNLGKKKCSCTHICTCVLFRTVSEIELFHCTVIKLLIRKRHYILFLIPVFIVQVVKLVQFTQCSTFFKIPPSASMHTWCVARLSAS
jgi:hypothetical protein